MYCAIPLNLLQQAENNINKGTALYCSVIFHFSRAKLAKCKILLEADLIYKHLLSLIKPDNIQTSGLKSCSDDINIVVPESKHAAMRVEIILRC